MEKTLSLVALFFIGYLFKRLGLLKKEDSRVLSILLFKLVIPALLISSFSTMRLESKLFYLPLASTIVGLWFLITGYILPRILFKKEKVRSAFTIMFPTFEGGSIGYTYMFAVFGAVGLSRIALYDLPNSFILFVVIYTIAYSLGKGRFNIKASLLNIIRNPIIWGIVMGILMNIFQIHNQYLKNIIDTIGGTVLLLAMVLLALEFEPMISSLKIVLLTIFIKIFNGFFIGIIVTSMLSITGVDKVAVMVGATLPPSIITLIYAKDNNIEPGYVANVISMGLFISLIFTGLLILFLK